MRQPAPRGMLLAACLGAALVGGCVFGSRGGLGVSASVRPQADGTTRVEFNTIGEPPVDAGLSQRVLAACNARMGR